MSKQKRLSVALSAARDIVSGVFGAEHVDPFICLETAKVLMKMKTRKRKRAAEETPIGRFVADLCVLDPDQATAAADLYDAWCSWCTTNAHRPGSPAHLSRLLVAKYPRVQAGYRPRENDGGQSRRHFKGIMLRAVETSDDDPWVPIIEQWSKGAAWLSTESAFKVIDPDRSDWRRGDTDRVVAIFRRLGFTERKRLSHGDRSYIYKPKHPVAGAIRLSDGKISRIQASTGAPF